MSKAKTQVHVSGGGYCEPEGRCGGVLLKTLDNKEFLLRLWRVYGRSMSAGVFNLFYFLLHQ